MESKYKPLSANRFKLEKSSSDRRAELAEVVSLVGLDLNRRQFLLFDSRTCWPVRNGGLGFAGRQRAGQMK